MPPAGEPTLMRFSDVETLFHEFGHGLHGLMTQIDYPTFSGVDGPRDYTEFPAQILEHWVSQPEMLEMYATHYETGEVIPAELVEKIRQAANHNQGVYTTEYVAASLLDLAWHSLTPAAAAKSTDARAFEQQVLEEVCKTRTLWVFIFTTHVIKNRHSSDRSAVVFVKNYV